MKNNNRRKSVTFKTVLSLLLAVSLVSINISVDKSITINEIRKIFVERGGEGANNQWKYDGEILQNDNQKLEDVKGFDSEGMAICVTTNVRGGQN